MNEKTLAPTARSGDRAAVRACPLVDVRGRLDAHARLRRLDAHRRDPPEQLTETLAAADAKIPPEALAAVDQISKEILYPMG